MKLESKRNGEGLEMLPVFAYARDEYHPGAEPTGYATDAGMAARIMRKFLAETDGDDYGLEASKIYYSRALGAWFTEE